MREVGLCVALSLTLMISACADNAVPIGAGAPPVANRGAQSGEEAMAQVVFVVPLEGAPSQTALILADAIAAELRDHQRPAILSFEPNQAGASVVGSVISAEPRGAVTWLTIEWAIRAPYGTYVATYSQQVVIDSRLWQIGAPEAINLLVADAAPRVINMVEAQVSPPMDLVMTHSDTRPSPSLMGAAPEAQTTVNQQPSMPLARISERTNGNVVGLEGTMTQASSDVAPSTSPTVSNVAQQTGAGIPPPNELPSLLTLPSEGGTNASEVQSAGPPRPLTRPAISGDGITVAPPPGGTAPTGGEDKDEGLLAGLAPNMDADARRPGDARPAGPGGAAFAQVRWGQPSFLIKPVVGAPGNGNEALTAGLKSALRARDVTISEDPRQAGFVIQGTVDMGDPVNGRQYVRISWNVGTVTGDDVGNAVQENTIVAGSLDGEWGRVAEAVSLAAVRGIQDLFGDADTSLREREQLPDFPDVDLPTIPGRAPPPPSNY